MKKKRNGKKRAYMRKVDYVDPVIGTVGDEKAKAKTLHGGGKTHPGACVPGGMVQLSSDTVSGGDNTTGYNYCQNTIEGFSFNHMSGCGWYGDLGNLQVMPITGETDLRSGSNAELPFVKGTLGWKSPFSHEKEWAKAGYYAVELERYRILAEATVAEHTGMLRMTYPQHEQSGVIFNFSRRIAGHADFEHIDIVNNSRLEGYIRCTPAGGGFGRGGGKISYMLYFVFEFSRPAESLRFFGNEEYAAENLQSFEGEDVGLAARFATHEGEQIVLRCGISYVDLEGARNNLSYECDHFDFERMKKEAADKWEQAFECVEVTGNDETDLTLFYTCLYHTLLDPRIFTDVDGRFRTPEGEIHHVDYTQRTMFSGWDVYRSEFPLLTILRPDIVNDEANSLLKLAEIRNSAFPRWELVGNDSRCMVGDPGLLVIADAYLKGIRNLDVEKAYEIALASCKSVETLHEKPFLSLRPRIGQYLNEAYLPPHLSETLEFLYADYVMSCFARALGHEEDAEYFLARAKRYRENFNPETGFMGPRDPEGNFLPVKDEYDETGCVESNIFQQSWFVPYDIEGLSELFGRERMIELLERLFEKADLTAMWNVNYNHSNEPCHNITHFFNELGLAHRTQYWTRRVQKEAYRLGAFGFCGNEDVGQLSAWYVLSALGFAQICMGEDRFSVNTPLFQRASVRLSQEYHSCKVADTFRIECDQPPLAYPYIKEMYLNGKRLYRNYLTYSEITSGGELRFVLSKDPCTRFGLVPELNVANERMDKAFKAAVRNLTEINTVACPFEKYNNTGLLNPEVPFMIRAGGRYQTPWTRDASVNSWNCASIIEPEVARNTLWAVCEKDSDGEMTIQLDNQVWDKIVWAVGAYHHYLVTLDSEFLKTAYQVVVKALEYMEENSFSKEYGLFKGGSFFNDGIAGYPADLYTPGNGSSFVGDHKATRDIMCLSTNCLYFKAYGIAAEMSRILGDADAAGVYTKKAGILKNTMEARLWNEEKGMYSYILYPDGRKDDSQEATGNLFAILFNLCDRQKGKSVLANLKTYEYGLPSIYELFDGWSTKEQPARHNNLIWPFINAWYVTAAAKVGRMDLMEKELEHILTLVEKSDYEFYEIYNSYDGSVDGGWQVGIHCDSQFDQTWSATGYIGAILYGIFGIEISEDSISIHPHLPQRYVDASLQGIEIGGKRIKIALKGWGDKIEKVLINGITAEEPIIDRTVEPCDIEIYLRR